MTGTQIVGVAIAVGMVLAVIVVSSVLMIRDLGWSAPFVIWGGAFGFGALFLIAVSLATGELP